MIILRQKNYVEYNSILPTGKFIEKLQRNSIAEYGKRKIRKIHKIDNPEVRNKMIEDLQKNINRKKTNLSYQTA